VKKIGIIGSDSTHAEAFAKLFNIPDAKTDKFNFPGYRVSAIYGVDPERTKRFADSGKIEQIVEKPEDMLGTVDAVMVVLRHGDLHAEHSLPFIQAGIPVWIDKPFTISCQDARLLINEASARNALLTGGSSVRFAYDILLLKNIVENGSEEIGRINSGILGMPASLSSEYGGIHFYGSHLAESAMEVFGFDPVSVYASENNGSVVAIVSYEKYHAILNFAYSKWYGVISGDKGTVYRPIDLAYSYKNSIAAFVNMMETKEIPIPFEHLYRPVALLNAVMKSLETGRKVEFAEFL